MRKSAMFMVAASVFVAACSEGPTDLPLTTGMPVAFDVAPPITGAIMTTFDDCEVVNFNVKYDDKEDVYVRTGSLGATAFKDGTYWMEVVSPGGTVLGRSPGANLEVVDGYPTEITVGGVGCAQVWSRVRTASSGFVDVGYDDTVNPGGVYILRVCGNGTFASNVCKSDMFKVDNGGTTNPEGQLTVDKFFDANGDGVHQVATEPLITGWMMEIGALGAFPTPYDETIPEDDYLITEHIPLTGTWFITHKSVDGGTNGIASATLLAGASVAVRSILASVEDGSSTAVLFGNYCTVPSGGRTLGFWSNKNGKDVFDGLTSPTAISSLTALNLRKPNGDDFDPANYSAFRTWLLDGNATNMAYMLSVQLAAMHLNVRAGYVDGTLIVPGYGGTVNALMAAANTSLGLYGLTLAGDPQRANQEILKNYLDGLNNGGGLIPGTLSGCGTLNF